MVFARNIVQKAIIICCCCSCSADIVSSVFSTISSQSFFRPKVILILLCSKKMQFSQSSFCTTAIYSDEINLLQFPEILISNEIKIQSHSHMHVVITLVLLVQLYFIGSFLRGSCPDSVMH